MYSSKYPATSCIDINRCRARSWSRQRVITAATGFGLTLVAFLAALDKSDFIPAMFPGMIAFMIGLGMIVNGVMFTVTRRKLPGSSKDARAQEALDRSENWPKYEAPADPTNELAPGAPNKQLASVTEHTTHHLKSNKS